MKVFRYIITNKLGLHARPSAMLVKEAQAFTSKITLEADGKKVDLKKLILLMNLDVSKGTEVTIIAEGLDEDAAIAKLEAFFKENL